MKSLYLLIASVLLHYACTTPKLAVPDKFTAVSEKLRIKGVNNWVFNQFLSFGKYETSKVKRGWTSTQERNFYTLEQRVLQVFNVDNFTSVSEQKNRFRYLIGDGKREARVYCTERMEREALRIRTNTRLLGDLSRTTNTAYSFCAAIVPMYDTTAAPWQLVVSEVYDRSKDTARRFFDLPYKEEEGFVTNGKETITINPLRLKNMTTRKGKEMQYPVKVLSGFELRMDDGVIAIIDSLDNNLYIYKELDEETRLVVAAICSALLLRKLEDTNG